MDSPDLILICLSAFIAVFVILLSLAVIMRLIILVFPVKIKGTDASIIAAIHSAYNLQFPATKIVKIEEVK